MSQRNWTFHFRGTPQACIDALKQLKPNVDMPAHVIDGSIDYVQYTVGHNPAFTDYEITSSGQWGGTFGKFGHVSQAFTTTHSYR